LTITYPKQKDAEKKTYGVGDRIDVDARRTHEVWMRSLREMTHVRALGVLDSFFLRNHEKFQEAEMLRLQYPEAS
jgi:hypothetical protein